MFHNKKLLKLILPATAVALLLTGCGNATHHSHKSASSKPKQTYTIHHKTPKDTKSLDGGTKTLNTKKQNATFPKHQAMQLGSAHHNDKADSNDNRGSDKTSHAKAMRNNAVAGLSTARHDSSSSDGLPTVDLGNGAKAEEDRGAGQVYVTFHEGNWRFLIHGNDVNESANSAVSCARTIDDWTQSHKLPIPKSHGTFTVNLNGKSDDIASVVWDGGHDMYGSLGKVLNDLQ